MLYLDTALVRKWKAPWVECRKTRRLTWLWTSRSWSPQALSIWLGTCAKNHNHKSKNGGSKRKNVNLHMYFVILCVFSKPRQSKNVKWLLIKEGVDRMQLQMATHSFLKFFSQQCLECFDRLQLRFHLMSICLATKPLFKMESIFACIVKSL